MLPKQGAHQTGHLCCQNKVLIRQVICVVKTRCSSDRSFVLSKQGAHQTGHLCCQNKVLIRQVICVVKNNVLIRQFICVVKTRCSSDRSYTSPKQRADQTVQICCHNKELMGSVVSSDHPISPIHITGASGLSGR